LYYCNGGLPELFIPVSFRVPKNTAKATKMEQSTASARTTNDHQGAGME